ncbi:hypothetical protein [Streptomyces sp. NPDC047315]|uniref:hypothetical protein n=1 Tax=Streptomyces sp. NPDC047315 TaxID=3155142 RepID=UPI003409C48B
MSAEDSRSAAPTARSRTVEAWRKLRGVHPTRVLRWLRTGMLTMVCATAVVHLLVAVDGGQEITSARRTNAAINDIRTAIGAAEEAGRALDEAASGQLELIGAGTDFANATARIGTLVTAAAPGNAAGAAGRTQIQFVQGQLTTVLELTGAAVRDQRHSRQSSVDGAVGALAASHLPDPDTGRPIPGTGGLRASLEDLEKMQINGLARQRDANWLDPVQLWGLAMAPLVVMLALGLATAWVLACHFHRHIGRRLPGAFAVTAAVAVVSAALTTWDEGRLSAHPAVGHPVTMTVALLALVVAGVLNHLAYRPRLAEYRFPRP